MPLLPLTAVPDLRLGNRLALFVNQLDRREITLVVSAHAYILHCRVELQLGVHREVLASAHLLRFLSIAQLDLKLVEGRPPVVSEERNVRDGGLLELLLGGAHTSNVNKEAERICLLVLVAWMGVVENS